MTTRALALLLATTLLACGGGGSNNNNNNPLIDMYVGNNLTCTTAFAACGGTLTGSWKINTLCGLPYTIAPLSSCPQAMETVQTDTVNGTVTFGADGTYTEQVDATAIANLSVPGSCLGGSAVYATCADFATKTNMQMMSMATWSCTGPITGTCDCTLNTATTETPMTATWTQISPTSFSETVGGKTQIFDYCVSGSTIAAMPRMTPPSPIYYIGTRL